MYEPTARVEAVIHTRQSALASSDTHAVYSIVIRVYPSVCRIGFELAYVCVYTRMCIYIYILYTPPHFASAN